MEYLGTPDIGKLVKNTSDQRVPVGAEGEIIGIWENTRQYDVTFHLEAYNLYINIPPDDVTENGHSLSSQRLIYMTILVDPKDIHGLAS